MSFTTTIVRRVPGHTACRHAFTAVALGLALIVSGYIAPAARAADPPATQPAPKKFKLGFQPNAKDAPAQRVPGISRGPAGEKPPPWVSVLVPQDRVGTTTKAQPVLYWYLSEDTKNKVVLTLTPIGPDGRDTTGKMIVEQTLGGRGKPPAPGGLQRLDLSAVTGVDGKPVRLEPNMQYSWVVTVEVNRVGQSGNPAATCRIQRIEPPAGLGNMSGLSAEDAAQHFAAAGVFLDTLAALNDLIDKSKADKAVEGDLLAERRELLRSQGLVESQPGKIDQPDKGDKSGSASR